MRSCSRGLFDSGVARADELGDVDVTSCGAIAATGAADCSPANNRHARREQMGSGPAGGRLKGATVQLRENCGLCARSARACGGA
eukprot:6682035-Prymnesium_polylepis.1